MEKMFDVIIVGGGPAGMSAGIYANRSGLKTLIIEKSAVGGQMISAHSLKNYAGFEEISGPELAMKMQAQAEKLGVEFIYDNVIKFELTGDIKKIETEYSGEFFSQCVILATGAGARPLGVKEEQKYVGKGVSYCAVCDGAFYKGKKVAVVGGGNSAIEDAKYLAEICEKVYLIHRRDEFSASSTGVEELKAKNNVKFVLNSIVEKIEGEPFVNKLFVKNIKDNTISDFEVSGVFAVVGRVPATSLFENQINCDEIGYILVNEKMETNVKGVFACGDVCKKSLRQIITAASDGAIAGTSANQWIREQK